MQVKAEPDHWKKKYFDALRSLEHEEKGFRSLESLLRRIVNRLCFAALGQTPVLDAEVRRLTEAMRKKADEHELERLFAPLSDAISALDSRTVAPPADSGATHRGVARPDSATVLALTSAFTATSPTVIAPIVEPAANESAANDEAPHGDASRADVMPLAPITDDGKVRLLITRILAEMNRDPHLAQRAGELEKRLAQPLHGTELAGVMSEVADLVAERIRAIEEQKADVEKLLAQISARLDEMTAYMAGENEDRKLSLENSQELNDRLTHEMHELGASVDSSLDLVQLKLNVRSRLDSIGSHLQEFRDREDDRVRQQWERSERMRERLEKLERESREMQDRLRSERRLSLVDALTQIPNRLAYDQRIDEEHSRWNRVRQPLCIAAWDIDHFKRINDAYGHRAGDKVLRIVAETLAERLRENDFVARYGGEEFVMVLPGTDADVARDLAELMRRAVEALGFHFRSHPVAVTISCGFTLFRDGDTPDEAFERADRALYRAKEAGRNRCELA